MFKILLMCLLTCCSSFMPQRSEEIIEDHTQVSESYNDDEQDTEGLYRRNVVRNDGAYTCLFTNLDLCSSRFFKNCYVRSPSWFDSHLDTPYYYYNLRASYVWFSNLNCEDISATNVVYSISYLRISYEGSEPYGQTLPDGTRPKFYYYDFKYCQSDGTARVTYRLRLFEDRNVSNGVVQYQFDGMLMDALNIPNFALMVYLPYSTVLYDLCTDNSYEEIYNDGYQNGYNTGLNTGLNQGYQDGYNTALEEAQQEETLALQIFTGVVEVGLLPVNVFLKMFEYEVFGINIAGFVSALMTIAIVVIIIRVITGKKND